MVKGHNKNLFLKSYGKGRCQKHPEGGAVPIARPLAAKWGRRYQAFNRVPPNPKRKFFLGHPVFQTYLLHALQVNMYLVPVLHHIAFKHAYFTWMKNNGWRKK